MMNERNPDGKDIRFIDSRYNDLFHIPDGGCIEVHYQHNDETVIKPCTFLDAYHTSVGTNVFHICEFAEVMERNGNTYAPEAEITAEQAAWQVGKNKFLILQTCDDGYDYTLFDKDYKEIDGGQLDMPELTMNQARSEILDDFKLGKRELRTADYDQIVELAEQVEMQSFQNQTVDTNMGKMPIEDYREIVAMQHGFDSYEDMYNQGIRLGDGRDKAPDPMGELANKLDRFAESIDPYEYKDQVDDVEANVADIKKDLEAGNFAPYREYLDMVIDETDDKATIKTANTLKQELDKAVPKKESVLKKLASKAEHTHTDKPKTNDRDSR